MVKTQARPHLRDFLMSDSVRQHLVSQSFFFLDGEGGWSRVGGGGEEDGGSMMLRC